MVVALRSLLRYPAAMAHSRRVQGGEATGDRRWTIAGVALVLLLSLAIRFGTAASSDVRRFDEAFSQPAITTIIREGWSVRTAIDFEETKGPGFIWPYAAAGQVLGESLPALRWLSLLAFVLGVVPLSALARRAGVHGPGLLAVALLYALLPQQALLGQLVMSEPLFVTLSNCCVWAFWWGLEGPRHRQPWTAVRGGHHLHEIVGPLLVCALMVVLFHSRVHVAALGLAMVIVAWERHGRRAWPWLLAVGLAGLLRLPLAVRWGGLVSPAYREQHQLGHGAIQWSNVAYLLAALVPLTAIFLVLCRRNREGWEARARGPAPGVMLAGLAGAALAVIAAPSRASLLPPTAALAEKAPEGLPRYLGPTASLWRGVESLVGPHVDPLIAGVVATIIVAVLAGLGAASLAELGRHSWARGRADQPWSQDARLLGRVTVLSLLAGMGMYAVAQSLVVDRYLVPWAMLLPILWWKWLPRWAVLGWAVALALGATVWIAKWLG